MTESSRNQQERLVEEVPSFIENREDPDTEAKMNGFFDDLLKSFEKHLARLSIRFSDTFLRPLFKYIMHYFRMLFRIIKTEIVAFFNKIIPRQSPTPESQPQQDSSSLFADTLESLQRFPEDEIEQEEPGYMDEHLNKLENEYAMILEDFSERANSHTKQVAADAGSETRNPTRFETLLAESRRQKWETNENPIPGPSSTSVSSSVRSEELTLPSTSHQHPGYVEDVHDDGFDSLERDQWEFQRRLEERKRLQIEELEAKRQQRIAKNAQANKEQLSTQLRLRRTIDLYS